MGEARRHLLDVCLEHLLELPLERRREALAINKAELLAEVEAVCSQCQRCSFLHNILSIFSPSMQATASDALSVTQMMAVLTPRTDQDFVNLMQFSWKDVGSVTLTDSLLHQDRLLASFMREALHVMQELRSSRATQCGSHASLPGPAELTRTALRLRQQQQDVLASLEELGGLSAGASRVPLPGATAHAGMLGSSSSSPTPSPRSACPHDNNGERPSVSPHSGPSAECEMLHDAQVPEPRGPPPLPAHLPSASVSHPLRHDAPFAPQREGASGRAAHIRGDGRDGLIAMPLSSADAAFAAAASLSSQQPSVHLPGDAFSNPRLSTQRVPRLPSCAASSHVVVGHDAHRHLPEEQAPESGAADGTAAFGTVGVADVGHRHQPPQQQQQERIPELQHELAQVHSRQSRLVRACEHGVAAAGQRLLLMLLTRCWESLVRSAAPADNGGGSGSAAMDRLLAERGTQNLPPPRQHHSPAPTATMDLVSTYSPAAPTFRRSLQHHAYHDAHHTLQGRDIHTTLPQRNRHTSASTIDDTHRLHASSNSAPLSPPPLQHSRRAIVAAAANESTGGGRHDGDEGLAPLFGPASASGAEDDTAHGQDVRRKPAGAAAAVASRKASRRAAAAGGRAPLPDPDSPSQVSRAQDLRTSDVAGDTMWSDNGGSGSVSVAASAQRDFDDDVRCDDERKARPCRNLTCLEMRLALHDEVASLSVMLSHAQALQEETLHDVHKALDCATQMQRQAEQAAAAARRQLLLCQGDPASLRDLSAEELAQLAAAGEASLARIRAAVVQATADRELLCPICWEQRKDLVFNCGHQTCAACGDKVQACPICRERVTIRIKVF